jgi:hypothetical protein
LKSSAICGVPFDERADGLNTVGSTALAGNLLDVVDVRMIARMLRLTGVTG